MIEIERIFMLIGLDIVVEILEELVISIVGELI